MIRDMMGHSEVKWFPWRGLACLLEHRGFHVAHYLPKVSNSTAGLSDWIPSEDNFHYKSLPPSFYTDTSTGR